ncbi:hypothetical protein OIU76_013453 [Salix suchowensis]|nr:hypothetical protein OIU76_013453 [Salix suchowensis]
MHSANYRGGSFEIYSGTESTTDDEKSRNIALQPQHHHLDETQQSWLLYPEETKKKKYVDLGCLLLIAPPDHPSQDFATARVEASSCLQLHSCPPESSSLLQCPKMQKYEAIGEYQHTRDLIRWGTDYLLLTFNSSASKIDRIYCQVGGSRIGSRVPDDHYCWQRPEDIDYPRPVQVANSGPDLAGEMAAALAAASIVFRDNKAYSEKLVRGAAKLYAFARDFVRRRAYSSGNDYIATYYNSSFAKHSKALSRVSYLSVPSWDNKLPAAMLLLTRYRLFWNPGYPYEGMLIKYHEKTELNMCSYLQQFNEFNWTKGGMIKLNQGRPQPLQFVANTAFLASLYVDYLNATGVPGLFCGRQFISLDLLRSFATSQFRDVRTNYNFTEPTLAGNAGLVAALASLTSSGGIGIDKNSIFAALPPLYPPTPPPLPAWKP